MGKMIGQVQGMLSAIRKADGTEYQIDDWRLEYIGKPGLIVICETENECPGSSYLRYIPVDVSFDTNHMRTGMGDIVMSEERLAIHTTNSTYDFTLSECLTPEYAIFLDKLAEVIMKHDDH